MNRLLIIAIVAPFILISQSANAIFEKKEIKHIYLQGKTDIGVILLHKRGYHPQHYVVNPLRIALNKSRDWHTLSLQMPNSDHLPKDYDIHFPDAYERIQGAITYLRDKKRVSRVIIIGHGMGARMAAAFIAKHYNKEVIAFIGIGMRNVGDYPLNPVDHLKDFQIPVLDIYNEGISRDKRFASERSKFRSKMYVQLPFPGTDFDFRKEENLAELIFQVTRWLDLQVTDMKPERPNQELSPTTPSI